MEIQMLYADYNSTTPVLKVVKEAMLPFFEQQFGNPSSTHQPIGVAAKQALEEARSEVASLVGAKPEQVVFLSGATESCFQALLGAFLSRTEKNHIIASAVEHPAVLNTLELLKSSPFNCSITHLPVNRSGVVSKEDLFDAISVQTGIVSVMCANNETGALMPIREMAEICNSRAIVLHTDAAQAVGKIEVDFENLGVDLLSFSGHKMGASKGIGALVIRNTNRWKTVVRGGGQENGYRGGTEALALAVGLGAAAKHLRQIEHVSNTSNLKVFEERLFQLLPDCFINSVEVRRLSNTCSVCFNDIVAQELVENLGRKGVMLSAGSACSSNKLEPSHVLRAMGLTTTQCLSTVRVSFGRSTPVEEAKHLAEILSEEVKLSRKTLKTQMRARMARRA